jgi:4-nitrophenyl phosphatase
MSPADATDQAVFGGLEFVLCDLDGVVWLGRQAIPGSPEAIERLRANGQRVLFVTNNSVSVVADHERALAEIGVPATDDVVTSAQAASSLVRAGERVLVCGGPGIVEAVRERGAEIISPADSSTPDVVVAGLDHAFDYGTLDRASRAIRNGARFVATNDDATFPTPHGFTPGAGAIVAAIATAAGARPAIAGKPHPPMADLVRARCGPRFSAETALMVGDRWATDGLFADVVGCPFALVRSGVTGRGAAAGGVADVDELDLAGVADVVLGSGGRRSGSR